jgi:DNA-binding Lrp family transcriptional regulator
MPITAIIFFSVKHGATAQVAQALKKIPEITKITSVTGDYDIIAEAQVEQLERLHDIFVNDVDQIDGVQNTNTAVVLKELLEKS